MFNQSSPNKKSSTTKFAAELLSLRIILIYLLWWRRGNRFLLLTYLYIRSLMKKVSMVINPN